ncbi:MAG: DUF1217 domain-containing protein [Hyphomicrobiaceae bacterium]|nr:DUF1217 domain-containing protein [Hyphomicrobiaceae bacterium]
MLSTYASYNLISKDLTKSLARTAKEPEVKRETDYYKAHVGNIKSVDDLMKNERVYRYVMKAYGLEDLTYAKGLIRKVLEGGTSDERSLANQMSDPRFKALAKAFDFEAFGEATASTEAVQTETVDKYMRQQLEAEAGSDNEGVRLALYFKRNAASVTGPYGILADKALLQVYQIAFDISSATSAQEIEVQAANIKKKLDIADLQDPAKVDKIIERFMAKYDIANNQNSDPVLSLFSSQSTDTSPVTFSTDLYMSMLNLKLGGV